MTTKDRSDVLQGTLDMLVLRALQLEPMHGWGIAERLGSWSEQVLQLGQGSLYPALYRMERKGWIESDWGTSENNRRAKFYTLTTKGRAQFRLERRQGRSIVGEPFRRFTEARPQRLPARQHARGAALRGEISANSGPR